MGATHVVELHGDGQYDFKQVKFMKESNLEFSFTSYEIINDKNLRLFIYIFYCFE